MKARREELLRESRRNRSQLVGTVSEVRRVAAQGIGIVSIGLRLLRGLLGQPSHAAPSCAPEESGEYYDGAMAWRNQARVRQDLRCGSDD